MERRGARRRALIAGLLVAACADPPFGEIRSAEPFALLSSEVWSGATLTLTSAGFAGSLPTAVLLDSAPLAFARLDDTTLVVTLPDRPGTHTLRVVAPDVVPVGVLVYLRGFAGRVEGPAFSGRTEPGQDPRYVFGNGPTSLRRWNLATNKAADFGDTVHAVGCTRGVGPGPGTGQLVLRRECAETQWNVWRTEPLAALPDTAAATTDRFVAVLAPGRWIILRDADFIAVACDSGGGSCSTQAITGTGGMDVVRSPRGNASRALTFGPCAVAVDPVRPWLYVAGMSASTVPPGSVLQVFDQRTPTPITTLHVTGDSAFGANFCRVLPNPIGQRVYVAETWFGEHLPAARAQLYSFDTPP